jgi:adenine-specific DNA-methyltransferase
MQLGTNPNDLILDFFAGSGTTGQAVMQLNAEDGGNRKFILCQIDEPIKEDKPAYKFCVENNLPPVISSITVERLKRAGEKIRKDIEEKNKKSGMFEEDKQEVPDIGFKVFDLTNAPKLEIKEDGQIVAQYTDNDPFSRIYNMIFSVGIDNPTTIPETVLEDCMYKIGAHYYITNAAELDKEENKHFLSEAIKTGKVFIDGWTASINTTLQNYREDVKIVF